MIIYQDTKLGFLNDVSNNYLQARIEAAFLSKTGSIPSDRMGWANDYSRYCTTELTPAKETITKKKVELRAAVKVVGSRE